MRHARSDFDRIQDPEGKIPEDEPVFLIRAQDWSAPATLRFWAAQNALSAPELAAAVERHAKRMDDWQTMHGNKIPDAPEGVELR